MNEIAKDELEKFVEKLRHDAEGAGYHLNPNDALVLMLADGLLLNEKRYGYSACPCRLASGKKEDDLDIICPCDYRDPDLDEFGTCYCGLYVGEDVVEGRKSVGSIPERRKPNRGREIETDEMANKEKCPDLPFPIWRCKVCGYLCARNNPPEICPICKAKKERFERFI